MLLFVSFELLVLEPRIVFLYFKKFSHADIIMSDTNHHFHVLLNPQSPRITRHTNPLLMSTKRTVHQQKQKQKTRLKKHPNRIRRKPPGQIDL